jgi:hypothetical protein
MHPPLTALEASEFPPSPLVARLTEALTALLEWIRSTNPEAWDNVDQAMQLLTGQSLEARLSTTSYTVTSRLTADELAIVLELVGWRLVDLARGVNGPPASELELALVERIRRALAES